MTKLLTKTDFILYRECPQNVWVKWHNSEEYNKFEISEFEKSLGVMGNEVEALARGMFPEGYLVEKRSEGAQELTQKLISERTPVIFQAVFATDKYLAATDVLEWNEKAQAYDLCEIKMSSTKGEHEEGGEEEEDEEEGKPKKVNKKKELQYDYDLAFQANVLNLCGVKINKKYLIRLNKEYVKVGDLDFIQGELFIKEDKTERIEELMPVALAEMDKAYEYLTFTKTMESPCPCYYTKGRRAHCTAFSLINPTVPEYSVHDLNRIGSSKAYLRKLLDDGILTLDKVRESEIPKIKKAKEGEKPGKPRKLNQVVAYKTKEPIIDLDGIKTELNSLTFPLYFLDYETYPTAIPVFNGYHPYQQIVFQYSLHVLTEEDFKAGREPEHREELILEGDPAEKLVESLRSNIGDKGSVIVWYKNFENHRNKELARLVPLESGFLNDVIRRTYDLMDIVNDQFYVHHGFKGSASIKKVQPVLAPDFSYKHLGVQNGTEAIEAYRQISRGELVGKDAEEKKQQMLEYCKNDTEVMYILWKFFKDLVGE